MQLSGGALISSSYVVFQRRLHRSVVTRLDSWQRCRCRPESPNGSGYDRQAIVTILKPAQDVHAEQERRQEPAPASEQDNASEQIIEDVTASTPQPITIRLLGLAFPLMVQNVVGYATGIINLAFVGALGAQTLSAFVLASSIYNVCGLSVAIGLSTGMDTLAGSAFGAKEYGKLGLILQRAVLVCWGACIPVAIAWVNADFILRLLGQEPAISALACKFLVLWIPCLFANVLGECVKRYLQAQRLVKPLAVAGLISVLMAPVWFHLTMNVAKLGMEGSALGSLLIQLTTLTGLVGYAIWQSRSLSGKPEQPWRGVQLAAAAKGWQEYLQYGIPAALMICLEWWVYEAVVIMAGWIPDGGATLACMGICTSLNAWAYMIPLGLAAAVNTSVSNALGAGDGQQAASVFRAGLWMGTLLQIGLALFMVSAGPMLVPMLCSDAAVRQLTISALPVLSGILLCDGLNAVVSGTLRGAGRQKLGATVNGICCLLAIPIAWLLAIKAGLGANGFWLGVGIGGAVQLALLGTILLRAKGGDGTKTPAMSSAAQQRKTNQDSDTNASPWWGWNWDAEAARLQGVAIQPAGH